MKIIKQDPIGNVTQLFRFFIYDMKPCELVKGCAACITSIRYIVY